VTRGPVAAMGGRRTLLVASLAVLLCLCTAYLLIGDGPAHPGAAIEGPRPPAARVAPGAPRLEPEGGAGSLATGEPGEGDAPLPVPPLPDAEGSGNAIDHGKAWDLETVRVEFEMVSASVLAGDPIEVTVRIWNDGHEALSLPAPQAEWMTLGLIGATVTYEGAALLPYTPGFRTGPRPRKVLPPGKCFEVVFDLGDGCRLHVPGEYRIRVSYDPEGRLGRSERVRECSSDASFRVAAPTGERLRGLLDRVAWRGDWSKVDSRALELLGDCGSPEALGPVTELAERARRDLAENEDLRGLKSVLAAILCGEKFECWEWIRGRDLDRLREYARRGSRGNSGRADWLRVVNAIADSMESGRR
jgi:hypothetical protein